MRKLLFLFIYLFICQISSAQEITFEEYDPASSLVVPENIRPQAKYPFIDVHNHQWRIPTQDLKLLALQMDSLNMAVMVNLSGRGFKRIMNPDSTFSFSMNQLEYLEESIKSIAEQIPGRVVTFTNIDFNGIGEEGWIEREIENLEKAVAYGANGLKIYKNLGMDITDASGKRVAVDDFRLDPIWTKCGELGIPVLIHSADPPQFWQPHDNNNERWLELKEKPNRKRDPQKDASWEKIINEQHNIFRKHPGTNFINAHLGWYGNNLAALGKLFDELPNMYTEIGAVIAELGRQPRYAKEFLTKYQDRVMFGKDTWTPNEYPLYFRVLETDDDYIKYFRRRHAFWRLYGLDLSDEVLKKIYYKNALKIIPGIDKTAFPMQ
ncbi:MAG: amidohydrolase [Bacteroidetes bacterium]|nr:amidohydrolase [Bacteroidota bacterium]